MIAGSTLLTIEGIVQLYFFVRVLNLDSVLTFFILSIIYLHLLARTVLHCLTIFLKIVLIRFAHLIYLIVLNKLTYRSVQH